MLMADLAGDDATVALPLHCYCCQCKNARAGVPGCVDFRRFHDLDTVDDSVIHHVCSMLGDYPPAWLYPYSPKYHWR